MKTIVPELFVYHRASFGRQLSAILVVCALAVILCPVRVAAQQASTNGVTLSTSGGKEDLIVFVGVLPRSSQTPATATYIQVPYTPNTPFKLTDTSSSSETLSMAGFILTPTFDFDYQNLAPSKFTPLPSFDVTLSPGGSVTASVPDLSSTMALLGFVFAGQIVVRSRLAGA